MSCIFCINYKGLQEPCKKGITVETSYESFNCKFYEYNGELKYESEGIKR